MCFVHPFDFMKCGKCPECLQDKRREWSIRLQLHSMYSGQKPYIAHLTYNNEHLPHTKSSLPTLCKNDVQLFIKRLRYYVKNKISYYLCGEYGPCTSRPHYHCIIFGLDETLSQDDTNALLQKAWQLGYVRKRSQWVQSYAQLHYVTKYVINFDESFVDDRVKPFRLSSNRFGAEYINFAKENNLYHSEIQDLFRCTYDYIKRNNSRATAGYVVERVPKDWLNEKPYYFDVTNNLIINPLLKEFPDFIEIYEINKGTPKTYRYPLPRYFSDRLYHPDFKAALNSVKKVEMSHRYFTYNSDYSDYDITSDVPMWLEEKRYKWNHKKKNYKDRKFKDLISNKLLDT